MYLTNEQEKMLNGEYGFIVSKALQLIVKVGEALEAERLVDISHAHISGVSYSNIGKYGLDFILNFYRKGGRAKVYTTINPGCVDYTGYSSIIDNRYFHDQLIIDQALVGMGFKPIFTCIPYYHRPPIIGEHLAWGESSAVIYANSIYGAFTNREGGPIALASSLTGYTYYAGMHLLENRVAKVEVTLDSYAMHLPKSLLGLWIGDNIKEIPYIRGMKRVDLYEIKLVLASMAAAGNHSIAIVEKYTPRGSYQLDVMDKVHVEKSDLDMYIGESIPLGGVILGYVGCPHLHPAELLRLVHLVRKYGPLRKGRLLVTIPPEYISKFRNLVFELRARNVDIAGGTCPVVSLLRDKFDLVVTNSGKAAFYLRRIHGLKTKIVSLDEVVKIVSGSR
ncbi:MAG: aconitase X catalytic domain-containing protein [Desulfurococcaceae archaeon]